MRNFSVFIGNNIEVEAKSLRDILRVVSFNRKFIPAENKKHEKPIEFDEIPQMAFDEAIMKPFEKMIKKFP